MLNRADEKKAGNVCEVVVKSSNLNMIQISHCFLLDITLSSLFFEVYSVINYCHNWTQDC